jgi:predicted N-acetyltransferase YhbS
MATVMFHSEHPLKAVDVSNLFQAAFGQQFDEKYWEWRFLHNPNATVAQIAYIKEGNAIVAYYAVSPVTVNIRDTAKQMALSNMTMTHPNHQGKGYFKLLAKALFQRLQEQGYVGVFGFANQNSHYGFRSYLNWNDLTALNNFVVTPSNFRSPREIDANTVVFETLAVNENTLQEMASMHSGNEAIVQTTRDYPNLKWRLLDIPSNVYFVLKVSQIDTNIMVVYKPYEKSIDIMEVFSNALYSEVNNKLLIAAIGKLLQQATTGVNIWANLYSKEHLLLEKHGFKNTTFSTYFGLIPFTSSHPELLQLKNWHFRFYDSDVY